MPSSPAATPLKRSDSSYWKNKEETLEAYQTRQLEENNSITQEQQNISTHYTVFVGNLKNYFFPDNLAELEILESFYDIYFFDLAKQFPDLLGILENLSELKSSLVLIDPTDPAYFACREALINLLVLTKQACDVKICNPRPRFFVARQLDFTLQLSTLKTTIQHTNNVVIAPGDLLACSHLTASLLVMHQQMETRMGAFRRHIFERPILHKVICAAGLLLGLSIFLAGALLNPMTFGASTSLCAAGALIIAATLALYSIKSDNKEEKNTRERDLAYASMNVNDAVTSLSTSQAGLFSQDKRSPEVTVVSVSDDRREVPKLA
jgi:hypothetical protein